ncbi:serine hydrolase domain-containing protein [Streptomyces murinus]|uniref:D-alanyl-D-alanine carboxypeptidase n=1 Tax=Streptomyces murinus TaxID=33900 RepID=A0A7W3NNC9_STRMR|nr:serine hydrolase domain-containing protein [Streptomyces murinus]MBA9053663.1 D-alanyl-D-alanine carboxypeptidase [Streptomyces murinus]UWW94767.1 serine hydrolase [Streptomyces murinus]
MRVRTVLASATALLLTTALATAFAPPTASAPAPPIASAPAPAHTATVRALEAAVRSGVPGATVTVRDTHGTWSATAGTGDLRTGKPRSSSDRYRIGSLTKTFVATVLLQLEAEGRLSLDDTVDTWLPGLVEGHGNDGRRITLRQLLGHTSGIPDYTADPDFRARYLTEDGFRRHRYDTFTPRQAVAIALRHAPDFAPGTSWRYSNTNYVIAGMVIEKATGRSYATEITRRLIEPLRLTATSVPVGESEVPRPSSRAYSTFDGSVGEPYDVTDLDPALAAASGAMISDSADLDRFYAALLGGRLLPARQSRELRTTVAIAEAPDVRYGLGLMDRRLSCGVHVWTHTGDILGSTSVAASTSDGRHTLALNFDGDWAGDTTAVLDAEYCGTAGLPARPRN